MRETVARGADVEDSSQAGKHFATPSLGGNREGHSPTKARPCLGVDPARRGEIVRSCPQETVPDQGIQYPNADVFTQAKQTPGLRQRQRQASQFLEFCPYPVEQLFA